jgi:D-ribose pyranose/furanose isomerase RbsD
VRSLFLILLSLSFASAQVPSPAEPLSLSPAANEVAPKPIAWVMIEMNWNDFNWRDLGLDQENSFQGPILESWQKYISENAPGKQVSGCLQDCQNFISNWQDKDPALLSDAGLPEPYRNGFLIKVSIDLSREKFSGKFRWSGRVLFLDLNSKEILLSSEISPEEKSWSVQDQKKLNSLLATRIYQSGQGPLKVMANKIEENLAYTKAARLVIRGSGQLSHTEDLLKLIKSEGKKLGVVVRWDYVQRGEARFLCFYRGEEKSFSDLLSQLKELKSSHSYSITHEMSGSDHVLQLTKK